MGIVYDSLQQKSSLQTLLESDNFQPCPQCTRRVRQSRLELHISEKCDMRPRQHPYRDVLPHVPLPKWLEELCAGKIQPEKIPLISLLRDSCFYPSSGLDSSPILIANGCVHSYIYVDYGIEKNEFVDALQTHGFSPYKLLFSRDYEIEKVVPNGLWPSDDFITDNHDHIQIKNLNAAKNSCKPFAHWSVWQRKEKLVENVGPPLFRLLFLCCDAIAVYKNLYCHNKITPKVIALIQPGHEFGNNYTKFNLSEGPLWKMVSSEGVVPDYILTGRYDKQRFETCPFQGYEHVQSDRIQIRKKPYKNDPNHRTINIFRSSHLA